MPLSTSNIEATFGSREESIQKLLSSILNLNLRHEFNEKHIISIINRLLSTAKHRKEGLEYLNLVIENCSPSVIAENAINWAGHCIIKFPDDILRELKLRVLGDIIEAAHNESEFNKKFVSDYISKVLDNCTATSHVNPYECKAALKTLTSLMRYYPSWFGAHRQKIETFVLIFLDSENPDLVHNAAMAFHYLQQVGSAGANGVNHKLNFTQSFHRLCRTAHSLYHIFYGNENELFHTERVIEDNVFEFQDDPSSTAQIILYNNARRIKNVLKFIETMIKTKFPVAKETKPKELLEVILRGTSIHKCISGDSTKSLEIYEFSLLLSEIQCVVLKLLRLFIIWYQTNCLPFSYSISKIVVDSIERTHNCECFKYDSLYQESAYRALSEWLSISKSSLHPQFQSQILVCILKDVTPIKNQITLTISEAASGKKSQKAKRRAMADRIISSGNQSLSNDSMTGYEKNNEKNTCKFALTALRHLLELTRLNVKPDLLKDLYKSIFDSLTSIQSCKPIHPYTDAICQARLYEVLVAIYCQNSLSILPPLQTTLDILTSGANDSNRFVSEICQIGLRHLEILCQPICSSLYLGVEKEEEEMEGVRVAREVIEIEEMAVDHDGSSSVDYDASTDEFPHNNSTIQDASLGRLVDEDQSDTDPFTNEELSDKGSTKGSVRSENLDEGTQREGSDIAESPTIDIVGEDETEDPEALQTVKDEIQPRSSSGSHQEQNEDGSIIEELQDERTEQSAKNVGGTVSLEEVTNVERDNDRNINSKDDDETELSAKETKKEQGEVISLKIKQKEAEEQKSATAEPEDIQEQQKSAIAEPEDKQEQQKSAIAEPEDKQEQQLSTQEGVIKNEQRDKADSSGLQIESEEPPAKKVKLISETDLDMGDVFDEPVLKEEVEKEGDPDSSNLEDDSFVDEVKDYY